LNSPRNPAILFAFLFRSDKFNDYIGRLAVATSASIGDSPKISLADARELQKRRILRLALKLASKLEPWVAGRIRFLQGHVDYRSGSPINC
jgi:hypothetical protein